MMSEYYHVNIQILMNAQPVPVSVATSVPTQLDQESKPDLASRRI